MLSSFARRQPSARLTISPLLRGQRRRVLLILVKAINAGSFYLYAIEARFSGFHQVQDLT